MSTRKTPRKAPRAPARKPARPGAPPSTHPSRGKSSDERTQGDVYVCAPGYEDAVRLEMEGARQSAPGVVVTPKQKLVDAVFARQVLPRAQLLEGAGPSRLADAVFAFLDPEQTEALLSGRAAWHVFAPDFLRRGSERPTPHPLSSAAKEVADILGKKVVGRAAKRGIERTSEPPTALVQVMMDDGWRAWCSFSALSNDPLRAWPSRFPAGRAPVRGFEDAPSSAYRKLVEALGWLGEKPGHGDIALDLGAAPGGWSYVLLELGVRVDAYDRAQLSDRVSDNPLLTHIRKDAFENAPLDEVDWVVCDVIAEPAQLLHVARRAMRSERLKGLIVTIKLPRPVRKRSVMAARRVLNVARHDFDGRIKHLIHNKNEVTLMARRKAKPS